MSPSYQDKKETIVQSLEQNKLELENAVAELRGTVVDTISTMRHTIDVRQRIREQPWPWLLTSFGIGLWLGLRH